MITNEWMAGFMDGEGTYSLTSRASRNGRKAPYWEVCVSVVNTNHEAMLKIQERFGGSMWSSENAKSRNPKHKITYQLKWSGDEALALIEATLPHLVMKVEQAEIVREYILHVRETPPVGRRGHSEEVIEYRTSLATKAQRLNERGA